MLTNRRDIQLASRAASAAYEAREEWVGKPQENIGLTVDTLLVNDNEQVRGFIASDEKSVLIAISGTESAHDVLADASIKLDEAWLCDTKVRVHEGFLKESDSVMDEIDAWFKNHGHSDEQREFLVTGHSLGGAVATLVALKLFEYIGYTPRVITFGSPRVGCRKLKKIFNLKVPDALRFVHDHDIVPWMPTWPYKHLGNLIHLDDRGNRIGHARRLVFWLCSFYKTVFSVVTGRALTDHYMDGYRRVVSVFAGG
jgi:predicted lipase